jgi:hypothetical protein
MVYHEEIITALISNNTAQRYSRNTKGEAIMPLTLLNHKDAHDNRGISPLKTRGKTIVK